MEKQASLTKTSENKRKNPVAAKPKENTYQTMDSPADQILNLQQTVGNQEVQRLLKTGTLQAKLTISQPNDKYEQEADRVAEQVMRMPEQERSLVNGHWSLGKGEKEGSLVNGHWSLGKQESPLMQRQEELEKEEVQIQTKPLVEQITPLVQRQVDPEKEEEQIQRKSPCPECPEKEEQPVQRKSTCPECPEKEEIQTKPIAAQISPLAQRKCSSCGNLDEEKSVQAKPANSQTSSVSSNIESGINSLKGGGQPLPESTRSYFEPRFGADFSQVRVHTDSHATETAKSINAKAFTTGKDIVFNTGQYSPGTTPGKNMLAHELTHVAQQRDIHTDSRSIIQRWSPWEHFSITFNSVVKNYSSKPSNFVIDVNKLEKLSTASAMMDLKPGELKFNIGGKIIGLTESLMKESIMRGSLMKGSLMKELLMKELLVHLVVYYKQNTENAKNHGESGCYYMDESTSKRLNLEHERKYIDEAFLLYNKNDVEEDDIIEVIGNALHVAQDRGGHGEGAVRQGHAKEIIDGTKPDDKSSNKTGYINAINNTTEVLNLVENILIDILNYDKKELSSQDNIDILRHLFQKEEKITAILFMKRLNAKEVQEVLNSREFKELASDAFGNKEMYYAIMFMHGDLYRSLEWMFDEGTDWNKVRNVIKSGLSGKDRVRTDNWMKEKFTEICNDEEMAEAVDLLEGSLLQKLRWMKTKGSNWDLVKAKIKNTKDLNQRLELFKHKDMKDFFVKICNEVEIIEAVILLGGTQPQKLQWMVEGDAWWPLVGPALDISEKKALSSSSSTAKMVSTLCHRDFDFHLSGKYLGEKIPARHCFVWGQSGKGSLNPQDIIKANTMSFDDKGSGKPDSNPWLNTVCTETYKVDPEKVRENYRRLCNYNNYDLTGFNCCTCALLSLRKAGANPSESAFPKENQGVGLPFGKGIKKTALEEFTSISKDTSFNLARVILDMSDKDLRDLGLDIRVKWIKIFLSGLFTSEFEGEPIIKLFKTAPPSTRKEMYKIIEGHKWTGDWIHGPFVVDDDIYDSLYEGQLERLKAIINQ